MSKIYFKLLLAILVLASVVTSSNSVFTVYAQPSTTNQIEVKIPEQFLPKPETTAPFSDKINSIIKTEGKKTDFYQPLYTDFTWYNNPTAHYKLPLPLKFGNDPLKKLPMKGPMTMREASNSVFMCATMDDLVDTTSFSNTTTFPVFLKEELVLKESRPLAFGRSIECEYSYVFIESQKLIRIIASYPVGSKTYKIFFVFPEAQKKLYLPLALYSIDNFSVSK